MIIDAHIHVGAWDHPDFLGRRCTLDDTVEAFAAIASDYDTHAHAARQIAQDYFAAPRVLTELLSVV